MTGPLILFFAMHLCQLVYSSQTVRYSSGLSGKNIFGPLEIKWTGIKGRGLFLTADVQKGEVLIKEKAFCYAFDSDLYNSLDILVLTLYEKAKSNEKDNALLAYLSDGIRPMELPMFEELCNGSVGNVPELSIDEIQGIVKYNSFTFNKFHADNGAGKDGSALWLITSFLNHDKQSNVFRRQEGEMKIITAAQDLKKGTELATMYHGSQEALKQWGIVQ